MYDFEKYPTYYAGAEIPNNSDFNMPIYMKIHPNNFN